MRFRGKTIRRKVVVLLLVPLVSLVSIWAFATYLTAREASHMMNVVHSMETVGDPVMDAALVLQQERRQVMVHLADPRRSDALSGLHRAQRTTDGAVSRLRNLSSSGVRERMEPASRERMDQLLDVLERLNGLRIRADDNTLTRGGAFQGYNELIEPCLSLLTSLHGLREADLEKEGRALVGLVRAREYIAREDALMASALAAGSMNRGDQRAFTDRIAERDIAFSTNLPLLPAEDREAFDGYWSTTSGRTLLNYEQAIIAAASHGASEVIDSKSWASATGTVLKDLHHLRHQAHQRYQDRIEPTATRVMLQAGAAGVLGLLAIVASVIISFRVARDLVLDLSALRKEANEVAGVRLPSVMRRLAAGDKVDVEAEAPLLEYPPDETGQVGKALNTLQRAALEAAVKQADVRRGVSEVFVNLARRNQVLLHRQLTLLDTMERRTEDADELADLFRLDHLTTRMRRHAEGLVILSGAAPSRQWRKPVQLMDVVRAAVGEVEDYERIEVRRLPRLAVDGGAVADLTHLVAELLENATVFSPPHTVVQVIGERVANGFTLEIHDRGLGLQPDALLDANLRLAETSEFELSDTDRLGLFVVSRLARRQGVRVSLQPSPYGGTTAVAFIPGALLTESPGADEGVEDSSVTRVHSGEQRRTALATGRPALPGGDVPGRRAADELAELDLPPSDRRGPGHPRRRGIADGAPAVEQHQHASDEPPTTRPAGAGDSAPAPLPRRPRGTPVLISDHGRRVEDAPRRAEPETATEPARQSPPSRADAGSVDGLPRRVRQASLAPQLRSTATGEAAPAPEPGAGDTLDDRDAEEVRHRMSSLQRGWQRGRRDNDRDTTSGDTAARTTPEGQGR